MNLYWFIKLSFYKFVKCTRCQVEGFQADFSFFWELFYGDERYTMLLS